MKLYFKSAAAFFALVILVFISCQSEENEVQENPDALSKTSELTRKLSRIVMNDTSIDNVIDTTSCFSVKLPVQITIGAQSMTVDATEDYAIVEDILSGSAQASVHFVYPITVIYPDYEEENIANEDQLLTILDNCQSPDPALASINCISVNFPLSVSVYDADFQDPNMIAVDSEYELFVFLQNLSPAQFFEINYPISIVNVAGETLSMSGNAQLLEAINTAISDCECDNPNILTDDLIMYIPFANEAEDLTGFANPVIQGETQFVTDRDGNAGGAISFLTGNADNRVEVNGNTNNDLLQTGKFTVSLWFNRRTDVFPGLPEELMNSTQIDIIIDNPAGSEASVPGVIVSGFAEPLYDPSWIEDGLLAEFNIWHHIVITFDGEMLNLYRDGILRIESNSFDFIPGSPGAILGGNFKGFLDDLRIYKRALSAQEVQTLYNLEGDQSHCLN